MVNDSAINQSHIRDTSSTDAKNDVVVRNNHGLTTLETVTLSTSNDDGIVHQRTPSPRSSPKSNGGGDSSSQHPKGGAQRRLKRHVFFRFLVAILVVTVGWRLFAMDPRLDGSSDDDDTKNNNKDINKDRNSTINHNSSSIHRGAILGKTESTATNRIHATSTTIKQDDDNDESKIDNTTNHAVSLASLQNGNTSNETFATTIEKEDDNDESKIDNTTNHAVSVTSLKNGNATNVTTTMRTNGATIADDAAETTKVHDVTTTTSPSPLPTLVCQLSGEMGNNLGHFAHCYALSLRLERQFGLRTQTLIRHQNHGKWVRGQHAIRKCFPQLRNLDFEAAYTAEYETRKQEQLQIFGTERVQILSQINDPKNSIFVDEALALFVNLTQQQQQQQTQQQHNIIVNATISIPFLYADSLSAFNFLVDEYYQEIKNYFEFDYKECCNPNVQPYSDESVFHYRNFIKEMPNRGIQYGFEELGGDQTANELFGHLNAGDKVGIISRFPEKDAQDMIDAFHLRGLDVRFARGNSGTDDFCFILNAQKEMVGTAKSTFLFWAGALSRNCSRVIAYSLDTPETRRRHGQDNVFLHYNWTNEVLRSNFDFRLLTPRRSK